mgnify:CR=1 FL=1
MHKMVLTAVAAATAALSLGALAQSPAAAPVDPNAFLNQFEATFGKFEGYRRSGAKGICATGEFVGTADARGLSTSSACSGQPVPVSVRFSVGGASFTSDGQSDLLVGKLKGDGTHVWSRQYGGLGSEYVFGVATDKSGNAHITGTFDGLSTFGADYINPYGLNDVFVCKYGPMGEHIYSRQLGGPDVEKSSDITVDASGNAWVTGQFSSIVDFGNGPITSQGSGDIFVLKLAP